MDKANVKSGIDYYDNQIFPKIATGEDVFNWYAFFLGVFWFPIKGLYRWFFLLYLLPAFVGAFLPLVLDKNLAAGISIFSGLGFSIVAGKIANREYYKNLSECQSKVNYMKVTGALLSYFVVVLFLESFLVGFTGAFSKSFKNENSVNQEVVISENYTDVGSTQVDDGDDAIEVDFMDLLVDIENFNSKKVKVSGVSFNAGAFIVFSNEYPSQNILVLDTSNLSKEIKKSLLTNCGAGYCEIKAKGVIGKSRFGNTLFAESVE